MRLRALVVLPALLALALFYPAPARTAEPPPVALTINPASIGLGQTATITAVVTNTNPGSQTIVTKATAEATYLDGTETKTASGSCDLQLYYPGGNPWKNLSLGFQIPVGMSFVPGSIVAPSSGIVNAKAFIESPYVLRLTGESLAPGTSGTLTFQVVAVAIK